MTWSDSSRALCKLQDPSGSSDAPRPARTRRNKIRLSRHRILESAMKVMDMYGRQRGFLEFEYFHEVGTGLVVISFFVYTFFFSPLFHRAQLLGSYFGILFHVFVGFARTQTWPVD